MKEQIKQWNIAVNELMLEWYLDYCEIHCNVPIKNVDLDIIWNDNPLFREHCIDYYLELIRDEIEAEIEK